MRTFSRFADLSALLHCSCIVHMRLTLDFLFSVLVKNAVLAVRTFHSVEKKLDKIHVVVTNLHL